MTLEEEALGAARAIFIAVDERVAKDISRILHDLVRRMTEAEALAAQYAKWNDEAKTLIEGHEDGLRSILSWAEAYPLDIFPAPDLKKARALLEAGGITLDAVSAHCMRHVVLGVARIARDALKGGANGEESKAEAGGAAGGAGAGAGGDDRPERGPA